MTLRELLDSAAAEFDDVSAQTLPDGSVAWDRQGAVFTTLEAGGTEATFRLDPVLATAARRTPDVGAAARGPEWVRFHPSDVDAHAEDRARAWFVAAHRRAAP